MKIAVGIRTCASNFNFWNSTRVVDADKRTILLTCINSMLKSAKESGYEYSFSIHDDNSGEEVLKEIQNLFDTHNYSVEIFHTEKLGTFKSQYEWIKNQNAEYYYCSEEDYLHQLTAFRDMVEIIDYMKEFDMADYAVFPFNCPHRYLSPEGLYGCYIVRGPKQYWRSVFHSTHTFFISSKNFHEYDDIMKLQAYDWPQMHAMEDGTINRIWKEQRVRLLCPMESLAIHLADDTQKEPYFDYMELWNKNLIS